MLSFASARAQLPEQITIEWQDDAACPRPLRLSLESEVARLVGPSANNAPKMEFDVRVERVEPRTAQPYRLSLKVQGGGERKERKLDLESCAEAQDAAALLIATSLDPDALMREKPPERERPVAQVVPRPRPVTPHPWSLVARALFDVSSLPKPTGGAALGALLQRGRLRAWSEARYLAAREVRAARIDTAGSRVRADVDLFTVVAGAGYLWPFGAWVVGPAAELELGALRARGQGGGPRTTTSNEAAPWGALDVGGVAGWGVHRRVGLELSMYAGLPLWRPQLAVRDAGSFYTTRAVTMRVAVGVRVSLGSP